MASLCRNNGESSTAGGSGGSTGERKSKGERRRENGSRPGTGTSSTGVEGAGLDMTEASRLPEVAEEMKPLPPLPPFPTLWAHSTRGAVIGRKGTFPSLRVYDSCVHKCEVEAGLSLMLEAGFDVDEVVRNCDDFFIALSSGCNQYSLGNFHHSIYNRALSFDS